MKRLRFKKIKLIDVIMVLRKQQSEHGDLASIEDLIDLLKKNLY